jgi:hypothetical protein
VPSRIWLGLEFTDSPLDVTEALTAMDGVDITGLKTLGDEDLNAFLKHVWNTNNWAAKQKRKAGIAALPSAAVPVPSVRQTPTRPNAAAVAKNGAAPGSVVQRKAQFVIPRPGVGNAIANTFEGMVSCARCGCFRLFFDSCSLLLIASGCF